MCPSQENNGSNTTYIQNYVFISFILLQIQGDQKVIELKHAHCVIDDQP